MIKAALVPPISSSCSGTATSWRNLKSKSGTRIIDLLVPLCFRSSCQRVRPCITNFGSGALVCLALVALGCHFSQAQDIAGIEDCTKTAGLDKRTSCLQSNVNFLQRLVTKNALEAEQRLKAATNEIVALKSTVTSLQTVVQELKAAQKPASDKKTDRMP